MPKRIQLKRTKGWKMPENTVKVDRSTRWGNPFITGEYGNQLQCVQHYILLLGGLLTISKPNTKEQKECHLYVAENIQSLRGKNLACWCKPGAPCHAEVLLLLANHEKETASDLIHEMWLRWSKEWEQRYPAKYRTPPKSPTSTCTNQTLRNGRL